MHQLVAAAGSILASPVLASWTDSLTADAHERWWHTHPVPLRLWIVVAVMVTGFATLAAGAAPTVAWWLFATAGAVLVVVDFRTHRLPARFVGPLALIEAATLVVTAVVEHQPDRLIRAVLAGTVVLAAGLVIALIHPPAIGLGDVNVSGIAAGLLGWTSWDKVVLGQVTVWLLALFVLMRF